MKNVLRTEVESVDKYNVSESRISLLTTYVLITVLYKLVGHTDIHVCLMFYKSYDTYLFVIILTQAACLQSNILSF